MFSICVCKDLSFSCHNLTQYWSLCRRWLNFMARCQFQTRYNQWRVAMMIEKNGITGRVRASITWWPDASRSWFLNGWTRPKTPYHLLSPPASFSSSYHILLQLPPTPPNATSSSLPPPPTTSSFSYSSYNFEQGTTGEQLLIFVISNSKI